MVVVVTSGDDRVVCCGCGVVVTVTGRFVTFPCCQASRYCCAGVNVVCCCCCGVVLVIGSTLSLFIDVSFFFPCAVAVVDEEFTFS